MIPFSAEAEIIPETLKEMLAHPAVDNMMQIIRLEHEKTVEEQCELALIEAPPLNEGRRAAEFARRLKEAGLDTVRVDDVNNALGKMHGSGEGTVLLEAHLDTVFPFGTAIGITKDADKILIPGICDNCRGLAAVITIARAMRVAGIKPVKTIVFAGTAGEEGLGDLAGMRRLFSDAAVTYDASISIDGHGTGHFVFDGAGSRRYAALFETVGGHSWTDFGLPSAVHAAGRAISKIASIKVASSPKTTFNVGLVKGGTSVNAIAQKAEIIVDLRSVSPLELDALENAFMEAVRGACIDEEEEAGGKAEVKASFTKVGDRPAGSQVERSLMRDIAKASSKALGLRFEDAGPSSTNANIPASLGIPCLCVGAGGEGGGIHTKDEWFIPSDGWKAVQQAALILLATAGIGV